MDTRREEFRKRWFDCRHMHRLPIRNHKVYKFPKCQRRYMLDDNVFRFDVSVNDSIAVQIWDSLKNIAKYNQNRWLRELLVVLDKFEEMIARAVLHDEINVVFVIEQAIELNYIGVVEEKLYLDLSAQGSI